MSEARRSRQCTRNKGVSVSIGITSKKKESEQPNATPSSQSISSSNAAASAPPAVKASAPAAFVEKDFDIFDTHSNSITSIKELIQPDAIPSESSINGSRRKQESGDVKHQDIRPCSLSTSSSSIAVAPNTNQSSPHDTDANNSNKREKKKMVMTAPPAAFVEKDFIEGEGESRPTPLPETITSGHTSNGSRAKRKTTKEQYNDDNIHDGVAIESEDSLTADNDTNNNQKKRRKHGSRMTPIIKSEGLLDNNDDDAYPCAGTRRSRRKRKQYSPERGDFKNKKRKSKIQQGGKPVLVINNTRRTSPRRNKKHQEEYKKEEEEDLIDATIGSNIDNNEYSNDIETKSCCKLCNDPEWENKIYYKCGTVLSKYFPKSNNNPNPGWYKGTIQMHYVSSSDYCSDYEYEEEADSSSEGESDPQPIIYNEILYEDGDTENITQDDLKLQLGGGRNVKILHSTKMATASNSECSTRVVIVGPPATSSDNKRDRNWLKNYNRLKQFTADNGHCRVPKNYGPDPSLGIWVSTQRTLYNKGTLAADRVEKLNVIGFEWVVFTRETWDVMFNRIKRFKEENGHCRVPNKYGPDPALGKWVHNQRQRKGNVAKDRVEKLNKIGFDWDPYNQTWDEMFGRLGKFKEENGHCRVPNKYGPDPALGIWVHNQRQRKGNVAKDRVEKLNKIGFDWDPAAKTKDLSSWQAKYNRLKKFKDDNGHCRVPKNYGPDRSLANWVMTQRITYKQRKLAEDRVEKLDEIGFEWATVTETPDQAWQEKYDRLIIFKAKNGHCRVPQRYDSDPSLGSWVNWQRMQLKKGTLAPDREQKLEEIGFEWCLRNC